jgi:AcrR family transcriptional regulator
MSCHLASDKGECQCVGMEEPLKAPRKSYRGVAAEERRAQRRQRLIETARVMYGGNGFRNTTVKAICDGAGLTERYFYESFENAHELLMAAFRNVTAEMQGCMRDASRVPTGSGRERVQTILRAWFDALRNDPESARLFLIETISLGGEFRRLLDKEMARFIDLLEIGWKASPSGPSLLKTAISGGLIGLAAVWIEDGYGTSCDELVAAALQLSSLMARGG